MATEKSAASPETIPVCGWGKPNIKSGETGENDALSVALEDVGKIKEDSTTLEVTKGTVNELFGEGHELVDKMELEGSWLLKFTIIKASLAKLAQMYGLTLVDGKLPMTTTVVSQARSYVVEPLLKGAICAEIPKSYTSITPKFATKEGWTIEVEVSSLQPSEGAPCTLYPKGWVKPESEE